MADPCQGCGACCDGGVFVDPSRESVPTRYLKRDQEGKVLESPVDMFRRVARTIASAESRLETGVDPAALEGEFYRMMTELEFLPNSPTLMNAGRELGQLSACFVLPVGDSMESIFEAIKNTAPARRPNCRVHVI